MFVCVFVFQHTVIIVRSQILDAASFKWENWSEEQMEEHLQELLKINHEEHQYEPQIIDHAKPEFRKYSYIVGKGRESIQSQMNRDELKMDQQLTSKGMEQLSLLPSAPVNVKLEHPEHQELKNRIGVAKSGKAALEKLLGPLDDVIEALAHTDKKTQHAELEAKSEAVASFIKDMRKEIAAAELVLPDDVAKINTTVEEVETLIAKAKAHTEGCKSKLKLAKSLLLSSTGSKTADTNGSASSC